MIQFLIAFKQWFYLANETLVAKVGTPKASLKQSQDRQNFCCYEFFLIQSYFFLFLNKYGADKILFKFHSAGQKESFERSDKNSFQMIGN